MFYVLFYIYIIFHSIFKCNLKNLTHKKNDLGEGKSCKNYVGVFEEQEQVNVAGA